MWCRAGSPRRGAGCPGPRARAAARGGRGRRRAAGPARRTGPSGRAARGRCPPLCASTITPSAPSSSSARLASRAAASTAGSGTVARKPKRSGWSLASSAPASLTVRAMSCGLGLVRRRCDARGRDGQHRPRRPDPVHRRHRGGRAPLRHRDPAHVEDAVRGQPTAVGLGNHVLVDVDPPGGRRRSSRVPHPVSVAAARPSADHRSTSRLDSSGMAFPGADGCEPHGRQHRPVDRAAGRGPRAGRPGTSGPFDQISHP